MNDALALPILAGLAALLGVFISMKIMRRENRDALRRRARRIR